MRRPAPGLAGRTQPVLGDQPLAAPAGLGEAVRQPRAGSRAACRRGRSRALTEVMRTWSMPQGTIHSNGWRSLSTFTASPWVVTPRDTCTPIEPILRSPAQTPVNGARAGLGDDALVAPARPPSPPPSCATKRATLVDGHDRVGHQLAGPVVGHAPAAVAVLHGDALEPVPVLAHRQVGRLGAAPARVHRRMLEHEQHVGNLARLAARAQLVLKRGGLAVGHETKLCDPELVHASKATLPPVDPEERFWPSRVRWRLRGAWMWPAFVALTLARRAGAPPAAAGGHRRGPRARHPARRVRQPRARGRRGPWLARRIWARRPAAAPGRSADGPAWRCSRTGSAPACSWPSVVGVLAAGLAARPLVVAETDARERAADAILRVVTTAGTRS